MTGWKSEKCLGALTNSALRSLRARQNEQVKMLSTADDQAIRLLLGASLARA